MPGTELLARAGGGGGGRSYGAQRKCPSLRGESDPPRRAPAGREETQPDPGEPQSEQEITTLVPGEPRPEREETGSAPSIPKLKGEAHF